MDKALYLDALKYGLREATLEGTKEFLNQEIERVRVAPYDSVVADLCVSFQERLEAYVTEWRDKVELAQAQKDLNDLHQLLRLVQPGEKLTAEFLRRWRQLSAQDKDALLSSGSRFKNLSELCYST